MMASIAGWINLFTMAFLFVGDAIIEAFYGRRRLPTWLEKLKHYVNENKFQVGIFAFFGSSMIQNNLLATGAFEVYVNGKLEFSKLEQNRMPEWGDITQMFASRGVYFK